MQRAEVTAPAGRGARAWAARLWLPAALLAAALCLWVLAYQVPLAQTIHVGGEADLARRRDDEQFLRGENGSEPADRLLNPGRPECQAPDPPDGCEIWWWEEVRRTGKPPYRWMSGDAAVVVPGAGGGPYLVELVAQSGRPDNLPAPSVWAPGALPPFAVTLPASDPPRRYRLLVPADARGEVRLTMRTEPYASPGDPRELGFVLHQVRLWDVGSAPRAPAWPLLGALALAVGAAYGIAAALRVGPWGAAALAGGAALAAGAAIALARPAIGGFGPALAGLALGCVALAAAGWPLTLLAPTAARRTEAAHVLALVLLAFALRMGGMLHPQALFSDLGFQANKLFEATLGNVFLTAPLPADAGGGQAPYPPGFYLLLMPGELLAPTGAGRRLLVQGGAALFDSLAVALVWALVRRAGLGVGAAALGAACYLLPTPALESFSIGEYANLGGQALALPLLALVGLGALAGRRAAAHGPAPSPPRPGAVAPLALLVPAVALGLLGHSGVTLSVGATVAALWLSAWAWRLRRGGGPVDPVLLTVGAAAGLGLALLIFYSAPVYLGVFAARAGGGGGGTPLPQVLADTARALLGLAPPQATRVALPPLLGPLGLAGLALLAARGGRAAAPLLALLLAMWAGTALTLGLLLVSDQGVRWAIFLYPALCAGAGAALGWLWGRGGAGRIAALGLLAVVVGAGMIAWVVQIRDYIYL